MNQGVFIVLGSHITELNACFDGSSPLYLQGFFGYKFKPLNHLQMLRFVSQFNLPLHDMMFYSSVTSGLIGVLPDFFSLVRLVEQLTKGNIPQERCSCNSWPHINLPNLQRQFLA